MGMSFTLPEPLLSVGLDSEQQLPQGAVHSVKQDNPKTTCFLIACCEPRIVVLEIKEGTYQREKKSPAFRKRYILEGRNEQWKQPC